MALQKYDIRTESGAFEERYWSPVNSPVFDEKGEMLYIIHRAEDVTAFVRLRQNEEALQTQVDRVEAEVYLRAQQVQIANQKLAEVNVELMAGSRMKSEFLATMSHELRTPLNAIIGFSEIMRLGVTGPLTPTQHEYMEDIFNSGKHLLSLINDILDLSKIEAGKMGLDLEPLDLSLLLRDSLTVVKDRASAHAIELRLDVPIQNPTLMLDRRKTLQIIYNLLANAVKFSPDGGTVSLQAHKVTRSDIESWHSEAPTRMVQPLPQSVFTDFLQISIRDVGCGIAAEDMPRLFKAFSQIDSSLSRTTEGTGLGLALILNLVQLHQGTVALESRPGQGSCFTVWLPWR